MYGVYSLTQEIISILGTSRNVATDDLYQFQKRYKYHKHMLKRCTMQLTCTCSGLHQHRVVKLNIIVSMHMYIM